MAYGTLNADLMTTSDAVSSAGLYGFKNRIINGAMMIDQRNSGASVTPANSYTLDRWYCSNSQSSKFTVQQNASSVTTQAGFPNYLGATSSSAYSVVAGDFFTIIQFIEGFNVADLAFGTSSAATVTVSFWVRSSLTGTFGGSLRNYAGTRSYPFTYTISSANTWEQKSITIAGDTGGTWVGASSNGSMILTFSLGAGSTYSGTAGAWASANYISATGATSVVGTNGATFYITGVQLEKGSTATSFDYRPYGTELQLCQRYFEKSVSQATAIQTSGQATFYAIQLTSITNSIWYLTIPFKVTKRAAPSVTTYPYTTATNTNVFSNNSGTDYASGSASAGGIYDTQFSIQNNSGGTLAVGAGIVFGSWFASAEL